ncbi:MAG: hypothetical protein HYU63_04420 [Armatimonadetes bacterium]|nr:hypothetical protein [Armatimonadota bacterium]
MAAIHSPDKADDQIYLKKLRQTAPPLLEFFKPDFIFYIAGADPYKEDILGGLNLTINGLKERDELIFSQAFQRKIPIASVLAGGYAKKIKDLIKIHFNTALTALEVFGDFDYNLDNEFNENTNKNICQVDI